MRTPYRKLSNPIYRWLGCLSVSFVLCAILLPMPVSLWSTAGVEKDQSQLFPCQNRPCGCRSAEQCFKKCCCFTNTQKVSWARANGVELPDYVLVAAEKESAAKTKPCALCSKAKENGSWTKCAESITGALREQQTATPQIPKVTARTKTSKWVLTVYAAECQGQTPFSMCFPATILPARVTPVTLSLEMNETFHHVSERLSSMTLRPPLPPPKIV